MEKTLLIGVRTALALVLLAPLIVMVPPLPATYYPFIVGKALYSRALIEIAFGIWVVLALRYPSYRAPRSRLLLILGVYVLVALVASQLGVSPQRSLWSTYERMQGVVDLVHWFAFTWVLVSVFRSWPSWRALVNVNLAVGLGVGLIGIAQHFDFLVLGYVGPFERLGVTFGNPAYVGAYMAVNAMLALGLLGQSLVTGARGVVPAVRWWRGFWLAVVFVDFAVLYLSASRGALASLLAGLAVFIAGYVVWGGHRPGRRISTAVGISALVILLAVTLAQSPEPIGGLSPSQSMLPRVAGTGRDDASLSGRAATALIGLRGFAARPLLGWGPGNFSVAYNRYLTADVAARGVVDFDRAHNNVIEELTTTGILGFAGYLAIWAYMLLIIARKARQESSEARVLALFAGAALTAHFVQNLFLFNTAGTVPQLFLLIGIVVYLDTAEEAVLSRAQSSDAGSGLESSKGGVRRVLHSPSSLLIALTVTGTLVAVTVYFVGYRPYDGARKMHLALDPDITWSRRLHLYDQSISAFPPLANLPRVDMFGRLADDWRSLNAEEAGAALAAAEREGQEALEAEPQDWLVRLSLASLYQSLALALKGADAKSSVRARPLMKAAAGRARPLVEEAVELAPGRIEVVQMLALQHMIEDDYDGARQVVDRLLLKHPTAARHFDALLDEIAEAAGR